MLKHLLRRKPKPADSLYAAIVASARHPRFYAELGVANTVDGRFDMITLHMFVVLNRLKENADGNLAQNLVDTFFQDMDHSLREMGVSDVAVGKKVRKIAESFYGRINAYRAALEGDDAMLRSALVRNVYAGDATGHADALQAWLRSAVAQLAKLEEHTLSHGEVKFPSWP